MYLSHWMPRRSSSIDLDQLLEDLDPIGCQLSWPRPVSRRLDQLVERARATRTDRSELAAAILCAHDYAENELTEIVLAYRRKRARDVVLDVDAAATVIELPRHGPGRRRRRIV
jgi:hypothetical protein